MSKHLSLLVLLCAGPVLWAQQADSPPDPFDAPQSIVQQHKDLAPTLVELLGSADGEMRQYAAACLNLMGTDAIPDLIEGLKKKDVHTQANICYVIGHIATSDGLAEPDRRALPHVLKLVKSQDVEVRRRAAFCLHRLLGGTPPDMGGGPFTGAFSTAPPPLLPLSQQVPANPGLLMPEGGDPAI
jgi:HEAT repeat protein